MRTAPVGIRDVRVAILIAEIAQQTFRKNLTRSRESAVRLIAKSKIIRHSNALVYRADLVLFFKNRRISLQIVLLRSVFCILPSHTAVYKLPHTLIFADVNLLYQKNFKSKIKIQNPSSKQNSIPNFKSRGGQGDNWSTKRCLANSRCG